MDDKMSKKNRPRSSLQMECPWIHTHGLSYLKAFLENDFCKVWKETNIWRRHKTRHTAQKISRNSQLCWNLATLLGHASGINWEKDTQVNFKWRKLSEINANHRKKCYLYQEKSQAPTVLANTVFPTSQKNRPHHLQPACGLDRFYVWSVWSIPFRDCKIAKSKCLLLAFIRFPFQTPKVGNGNWAQWKPSLIPFHRFVDTGSPPHTGSKNFKKKQVV